MAGINITHAVSCDLDFVIDEIVARCNDDMHDALKALLLINEHLEAEVRHLRSATAYDGQSARRTNLSLHWLVTKELRVPRDLAERLAGVHQPETIRLPIDAARYKAREIINQLPQSGFLFIVENLRQLVRRQMIWDWSGVSRREALAHLG